MEKIQSKNKGDLYGRPYLSKSIRNYFLAIAFFAASAMWAASRP